MYISITGIKVRGFFGMLKLKGIQYQVLLQQEKQMEICFVTQKR